MIDNKDSAEKMVPSSEEEENGGGEKEEAENGDGEKEGAPLALDTPEKMIPLPVLPEEKKKSEGLNLNNEVVKMRKEVKRVRALIIRKLTRQISALKKKKGNEKEVERNQRRADRLLEEIHAMKTLAPDLVTRTALQQNLSFEQVCRNPKCKISERAVARIATHPQFNRKIQDIKAGIEAFKEERMKGGKKRGRKVQNEAPNVAVALPHSDREERDVEDKSVEQNKPNNSDVFPKDTEDVTVGIPETADTADVQKEEMQPSKGTRPKNSETKVIEKNKPENKVKKSNVKPAPKDQEASDVESSDGETKEYFDDSTEERFYKQSSESDDSDGVDDFFLGKVSRFKKRKKKSTEAKKMHDGKVTTSELERLLIDTKGAVGSGAKGTRREAVDKVQTILDGPKGKSRTRRQEDVRGPSTKNILLQRRKALPLLGKRGVGAEVILQGKQIAKVDEVFPIRHHSRRCTRRGKPARKGRSRKDKSWPSRGRRLSLMKMTELFFYYDY
ncbi:serum response factor-binding protein 1 isoform X2 [Thalassophryne amazonica]|uniref:serum response factor-binding protein 1 isoform X2 n=1 Tax=Thalassophryne amazonica TaxID=390379 RepID=UPI00147240B8|nr:serum response factor-binding protein 1 isoform X2 [Thalassophryne amazonica]